MILNKPIFNAEQSKEIEQAVTEAEKRTRGEILVVTVRRSDDYPDIRWRVAISLAITVSAVAYLFFKTWDPFWCLLLQFPAVAAGYWLGTWAPIQRLLLSPAKAAEEVHQRALQAFHEGHVSATQERTGILIFVSLLEKRVEILADTGIHSRVTEGTWKSIVDELIECVHEDKLVAGICAAVKHCGWILEAHFPGRAGDKNEIPNAPHTPSR